MGPIGDALIGHFGENPSTQENAILVRLADDPNRLARDFCFLEKTDCSGSSDTSQSSDTPTVLECPEFSKNKKCGKFQWDEIEFEEDGLERKFCFAMNLEAKDSWNPETVKHDSNSCSDYGATRLWFRETNGETMFDEMIHKLRRGNTLQLYRNHLVSPPIIDIESLSIKQL